MGNLTGKGSTGYAYPGGGQVRPHTPTSVGGLAYSYDANGNLLSGSGRTLNWDVDNKPYSITSGPMTNWETYRYDPDGERVRRTKGSTTTVYLAGGSWEETLGGERRLLQNFNGQVVAQRSSTLGTTYLHSDHLGGASVSSDFQGNYIQHQEFDPWGKVRSGGVSSTTTINYTGQRLDDGTGLLYYHARYYDPGLGRFLSADSIVPKPENPQAYNRYSYVYNNPCSKIDPSGHDPREDEPYGEIYNSAPHITQLTTDLAKIGYYTDQPTDDVDSSYAALGCTRTSEAMIAYYFDQNNASLNPVDHAKNTNVLNGLYTRDILLGKPGIYQGAVDKHGKFDQQKLFNLIADTIDHRGLVELGFTFQNDKGGQGHYEYNDGEFNFGWVRHTVVAVGYVIDKNGKVIDIILNDPADRSGNTVYLSHYLNYHSASGDKFGRFDKAVAYETYENGSNGGDFLGSIARASYQPKFSQ